MNSDAAMKRLIDISEELLKMDSSNIDYEVLAKNILSLCNARYVVFNLFNNENKEYTTLGLAGRAEVLGIVSKILGFSVIGHKWPYNPVRYERMIKDKIIETEGLDEFLGEWVSPKIKLMLEKILNVGKVYVLKISREDKMLGTFNLIMDKDEILNEIESLEVYVRQIGLLIQRVESERELIESENRFKSYTQSVPCGMLIYDIEKKQFTDANIKALQMINFSLEELKTKGPHDLEFFEDVRALDDYLEEILSFGESYKEFMVKGGKGKVTDVSIRSVWFSKNKVMALVTDITEQKKNERDIHNMNLMMKTLLDNTPQAFVLIGKDYRIIKYNKKSKEMSREIFGRSINNGELISRYLNKENSGLFNDILPMVFAGEEVKKDFPVVDKNKKKIFLEITLRPIFNDENEIWAAAFSCYDITELKETENALRVSEERFKSAALSTSDLIYELDLNDSSITWFGDTDKFNSLGLKCSPKTLRGWISCLHPDDQLKLISFARKKGKDRKPYSGEYRLIGADNRIIYVEDYAVGVYDKQVLKKVVGAITDITSRRYYEDQLKFLSYYDQLTETYNRSFLEKEIRMLEQRDEYPVSVIVLDVDGLKIINDTFGHYKGDEYLKNVAGILKKSVRTNDILARTGGDEFAVILPSTEEKIAERIVERIKDNLEFINRKKPELPMSISIGLASSSGKDCSLEEVFRKADDYMYRSKLSKGNSAKSQIIKSLMAALAERDYITEGHAGRLSELSVMIGERMKLNVQELNNLDLLAKVHDLGKVGIPDSILFKPGPLNDEEWAEMKLHPEKGFRIAISSPDLAGIADLILKHHERWDGQGYPIGLQGKEIPLECRIISVVDSYDAMINERPYSKAMDRNDAFIELRRCSGSQFDPEVVEVFLQILKEGY